MESITECLATNIKKLREKNDLTQAELAKEAGISVIFLQGIESGRKWISPQTVAAISNALKVSETKIFENCFEKKREKKKIRRLVKAQLEHIPDDIYNALATTCKHPQWKWETFRWIIEGYVRAAAEIDLEA